MQILQIKNPIECRIIKRLNRFVVNVNVDGKLSRAHINNTGRLTEFLVEGKKGFCFKNEKAGKTEFRLFSIADGDYGAVIDTQLQMRAFEKLVESGKLPWLTGCKILKRNARLNNSLIDYLVECKVKRILVEDVGTLRAMSLQKQKIIYIEVKSAAMRDNNYAMYPDCPSTRGRKHIRELTNYVKDGGKAIILFIAALPDVEAFKPNKSADQELFKLLVLAQKEGVKVKSISIYYNPHDDFIYLSNNDLEIEL